MANENLNMAYLELCKTYHAIDDFRGKLLGFLPLASGAGMLLLVNDAFVNEAKRSFALPYALPIGVFGFIVTLGLFFYELNGIRRCTSLITEGQRIEKELEIQGQFLRYPEDVLGVIGPGLASQVIYSAVLGAWAFVAAVFAFGPAIASILAIVLFIVFFVGSRRLPLGKPELVKYDEPQ